MVDHVKLEAACRKKLSAAALEEIRETVEQIPAVEPPDLFWGGIRFLLDREKLIDKALEAK